VKLELMPQSLPIDECLPEIVRHISRGQNLVVEAAPGAGKTTRVPPALLQVVPGQIVVLEPRRIAARMAARRVAFEMGESLGETVGYQVRFEEVAGPRTRLRFVTEGVLTRRLLSDPELRGVSVVVLDEFHERHLDGDLSLALLRRLQTSVRRDLKLIVMSATLDTAQISCYLGGCPVVTSEGRMFPIEVEYTPHSSTPLEELVVQASDRLPAGGHTLVFLPGAAEIRRAASACAGIARSRGWTVLPLHGDLPPDEQDRAVQPSDTPKLILSTNVAESSITIDGVTTVIDSGLARIASDSPSTGLPTLEVRRISKASAAQRAGRAGRTRPGRAVRLYPLEDYLRRPDRDTPEIRRRDLSQAVLELRALGVEELPWFEAPPVEALRAAEELLDRLAAHEDLRELARYPLHPRLARLVREASRRGAAGAGRRIAAVLSSGERLEHLDLLHALDGRPSFKVDQIERQLRRYAPRGGDRASDEAVAMAVLTAYPDRVARRRSDRDVQLANGKPAVLAADFKADLLVAVEVEERREAGPPLVRAACAIEPVWLLDLFPERIREEEQIVWNRTAERVEATRLLLYDAITIDETPGAMPDPARASEMLAGKAVEAGLHRWSDIDALEQFRNRVAFATDPVTDDDIRSALQAMCEGRRSFAELESAGDLLHFVRAGLGGKLRSVDDLAPERIPLKGRQVKVHYEAGQPPWIESRLQDFFGMKETPRIGRGQVPVVVRLLAPNGRPVQVTSDLKGFWERLYPQVRRELSRRYPKHPWPETPV
jgi:ATP-dependent helicase HrpB